MRLIFLLVHHSFALGIKFWRESEPIQRRKSEKKREKNGTQSYFGLRLLANITIYNPNSESIDSFVTTEPARASVR